MKKIFLFIQLLMLIAFTVSGQVDLSYYLPEKGSYNPNIPIPKSVIDHEVGEWHISHDRLVGYMQALDMASDRISMEITGYTHEGRPLVLLTITSPKNHLNLEQIRLQHLQLTDPASSASLDTKNMPVVFYMGHSIHGNEPSGSNAALLTAYYLAAAQGKEIDEYLNNTVILFDPSFNPDGLHRFSSWVNSRKSKVVATDPADMEHNEPWPGGRTNHYWFDLNRDWLVAQQPESQARLKKFHAWKPNVLTDHHEMGTNATFFFQPGVPSRVHPLIPEKNQELTRKIGTYHAKALDEIGSLYYTLEGYDDFHYGKGSTFPDVQGAIGILFEQGSSRGHAQESVNGVVRFPFTIRNQFATALSTLKAANELRVELLNYQRDFFRNAVADAAKDPVKAVIFGSKDNVRSLELAHLIARHQIDLYKPASSQTINGKAFDAQSSYIVSMNHAQYKLLRAMFEKRTQFTDSLFYDISTWTLPLAFGVDYEELKTPVTLGEKIKELKMPAGKRVGEKSDYAYVLAPDGYFVPRAMNRFLRNNIRIKVATEPFFVNGKRFERGSILIPVAGQENLITTIEFLIDEVLHKDGLDVYACSTGLDYQGVSLGSGSFQVVNKPEIAMLVGDGVNANDAGELWHLLDERMHIPVTVMTVDMFNRTNLNRYNTLVLPPGSYSSISEQAKERLKTWIQNGGVVIGMDNTLNWLNTAGMGKFEMKKDEVSDKDKREPAPRPYALMDEYRGAQTSPGAIFEATVDLTHPLLYGYSNPKLALFKENNLFMEKSKNPYANPITFGAAPLQSGYISKLNYAKLKNTAVVGVTAIGRGRVIGFTENLNFRAFWYGTNRLFTNAIYFAPIIHEASGR